MYIRGTPFFWPHPISYPIWGVVQRLGGNCGSCCKYSLVIKTILQQFDLFWNSRVKLSCFIKNISLSFITEWCNWINQVGNTLIAKKDDEGNKKWTIFSFQIQYFCIKLLVILLSCTMCVYGVIQMSIYFGSLTIEVFREI
jgi:hypothetical protein